MGKAIRYASFLLALLTLFLFVPTSVYARQTHPMDRTDVYQDLQELDVDFSKYQKDASDDTISIMHFVEYGYDESSDFDSYGLWVYLYNPSGRKLSPSKLNNIQMAYVNNVGGNTSLYQKYQLEISNWSTKNGFEYVFYKMRVKGVGSFVGNLKKHLRTYCISGFEILEADGIQVRDYFFNASFSFSGFGKGFSKLSSDTLQCNVEVMDTARATLEPASWKSVSSSEGAGHHHEVFSVYFAIPNRYIRKYGNPEDGSLKGLQWVHGSYWEYDINGIVSEHREAVETINEYAGTSLSSQVQYSNYSSDSVPFAYYTGRTATQSGMNSYETRITYNYSFNRGTTYAPLWLCTDDTPGNKVFVQSNNIINKTCMALKVGNINDAIATSTMELWYDSTGRNHLDPVRRPILESEKKGYKEYMLSRDDVLPELYTYNEIEGMSWWEAWWSGNVKLYNASKDVNYEDVPAMQRVELLDSESGLIFNNSYNADYYWVSEADYKSLKSFAQSAILEDCTTYVLHYAVRDYYSANATVITLSDTYMDSYYFEKTVFEYFDVLDFEFKDEHGVKTVIPVSANPVDVIGTPSAPGDLDPNDTKTDDDDSSPGFGDLNLVLRIVLGVVLVVALMFALYLIIKIITFPLRAFRSAGIHTPKQRREKKPKESVKADSVEADANKQPDSKEIQK